MTTLGFDFFGNMMAMALAEPAPRPPLTPFPRKPSPFAGPAFIYYISRGTFVYAKTGAILSRECWSGHGPAKNDPKCVEQKGVGPLPPGLYTYGLAEDGGHLGPLVMALTQTSGETYGRSGFFIHGATFTNPEMSSDGCIIAGRETRIAINTYPGARILEVRP